MECHRIISICGPDGVGKTTQIRLLHSILSIYEKYEIRYLWIRAHHTLAYLILKLLYILGCRWVLLEFLDFKDSLSRKIWLYIEFVGIVFKLIVLEMRKLICKLKSRINRKICIYLAERYLVDSIVTILVYFVKDFKLIHSLPMKVLFYRTYKEIRKGELTLLLLHTNPYKILSRRLSRMSRDDVHLLSPIYRNKALNYIIRQYALYRVLVRSLGGTMLDASMGKVSLLKCILEHIF